MEYTFVEVPGLNRRAELHDEEGRAVVAGSIESVRAAARLFGARTPVYMPEAPRENPAFHLLRQMQKLP